MVYYIRSESEVLIDAHANGWYYPQSIARWTRIRLELQTRVKRVKKLQIRRTRESGGYEERSENV